MYIKRCFKNVPKTKIRKINIKSDTRMGKSNGYRIIYYSIKNEKVTYLLTVYYKKDNNKIPSKKEIEKLIKEYCFE